MPLMSSAIENQIFVQFINLDRSEDRRDKITYRLREAGFEPLRCSGVDGSSLSEDNLKHYSETRSYKYFGRKLYLGEIGCFLSHLRALEIFVASNKDYGLVVEDDLVVPENFKKFVIGAIEAACKKEKDWQIVNLYKGCENPFTELDKLELNSHSHSFGIAHSFPTSAVALLWTRKGAIEFLDKHKQIYAPFDHITKVHFSSNGKGLGFRKAVLTNDAKFSVIKQVESIPSRKQRNILENLHYDFCMAKRDLHRNFCAYRSYVFNKLAKKH